MNVSSNYLIMTLVNAVIVVCFLAFLVVLAFSAKTAKNYRAYVADLKKRGEYITWAKTHKDILTLEKVFTVILWIVLIASLIQFGFFGQGLLIPGWIVIVSSILMYLVWPFALVAMLILSRLYKNVLKGWQT